MFGPLSKIFGKEREEAPLADPAVKRVTIERLPLAIRPFFLVGDEAAFLKVLDEVLRGTPYRAFANVRLRDIFRVTADSQRSAVYAKLRDQHVDFLLVNEMSGFCPVLGIELDGRSHDRPEVQALDQIKDIAFQSAGLGLLRLKSRNYEAHEVQHLIETELHIEL